MSGKFWASLKNKSSKLHLWNILNPLGMEQKSWVRDRVRLRNADLGIIWEVNYMQSRIIYMIMDFILVSISKYNDRHLCSMIMLTLKVKVKVTQSCLTLCDPMDYTVHGILQARILEWVAFPFPIQGSNPGVPHCRQILYQLSHQGSPRILEWVTYSFSSQSSQPRNWTGVSFLAGRFFTSWATRKANANFIWNTDKLGVGKDIWEMERKIMIKTILRTSLVAQWIGICLPV